MFEVNKNNMEGNVLVIFCQLSITAKGNKMDIVAELSESDLKRLEAFIEKHQIHQLADNTFSFKCSAGN